jgi:hypothetical protein
VRGGTLDDPTDFAPDVHIYTRSNVDWEAVALPEGTPAFEEYYDQRKLWPAESLRRLGRKRFLPVSSGWFALGVRLGSTEDERLVLGWPVRGNSSEYVLLAARSLLGMDAQVLVERERSTRLVATFMHLGNPLARAVWTALAPRHRRELRHLAKNAARRARIDAADS